MFKPIAKRPVPVGTQQSSKKRPSPVDENNDGNASDSGTLGDDDDYLKPCTHNPSSKKRRV